MAKTRQEAIEKSCPLSLNSCLAEGCGVWIWSTLPRDYEKETQRHGRHSPTTGRIDDEDRITFEKGASGERYIAGPAKGYCGLAILRKP